MSTREEQLTAIFAEFDRSAQELCDATGGLSCQILPIYRKEEESPKSLKLRLAHIFYPSLVVEFKYTAHGFMGVTHSILECLVYPDKEPCVIAIPLALFTDYCDIDVLSPLCIPMIANPESMREAFSCIGEVVRTHLETMSSFCAEEEHRQTLISTFFEEIRWVLKIRSDTELSFYLDDALYDHFTTRFFSDPYLSFLKGKRDRALKKLSGMKRTYGYERRLSALWQNEALSAPTLPLTQQNLTASAGSGFSKDSLKELASMLVAWFFLAIPLTPLYVGFYFLLRCLEGRNSLYLMNSTSNMAYGFLCAFLTAIAASYFLRFRVYRLLFSKDYRRYREMDQVQNSEGSDRFMKVFLHIIVIASVAFLALIAKCNLNFLEDGFVDNTKFLSVKGEYHAYDEVASVYYKPSRVNAFDETLEFPSYVLVLKDGSEIDFYEYEELSKYEASLLPRLREKGIPVDESQRQP